VIASALVIDDSAVQRNHAVQLCHEVGIASVYSAGNGREALGLLTGLARQPELLVVDLEMPTMDGYQLLEQLQKHGIRIPILVVSSREDALLDLVKDMAGLLGLSVIGALRKPLGLEALRRALSNSTDSAVPAPGRPALPLNVKALAAAIADGEIQVHYQPKADIQTGIVRGMEALARWTHPTLGRVPPADFIRLAEQSNLIHALTMRVMNDAMLQTASWMAYGLHPSIAINLSPLLLDRAELVDEVVSVQQCHGVPAGRVIFEITESSLVCSKAVALGALARLRLKGFGLSIDDYGTGFSSMQQLTRIPFTELKIDRSFVHMAHERRNLQVILRSALEMGAKLGITTVAEGVETIEDWRLLQRLGCSLGQGYLIAKPMSALELTPWLKDHKLRSADLRAPGSTGDHGSATSGGGRTRS
jgi:EAL domain-containing protein (putative c-di-GMP-specific phosphodiesterase class I)